MNRASPVTLRKCLEIANSYVKAGIAFVPMPVLDDAEFYAIGLKANERLEAICSDAESKEKGGA